MGGLSAGLETAVYDKGHGTVLPSTGKYKKEALAEAGVSTSEAHRCEKLAANAEKVREVLAKGSPIKPMATRETDPMINALRLWCHDLKRENNGLREKLMVCVAGKAELAAQVTELTAEKDRLLVHVFNLEKGA